MPSRVAVIAIDAVNPQMVADFWCKVLGWHVVGEGGRVISIAPTDGAWPTRDARAGLTSQSPDVSRVVIADPEGNEFCLLSRSVQET